MTNPQLGAFQGLGFAGSSDGGPFNQNRTGAQTNAFQQGNGGAQGPLSPEEYAQNLDRQMSGRGASVVTDPMNPKQNVQEMNRPVMVDGYDETGRYDRKATPDETGMFGDDYEYPKLAEGLDTSYAPLYGDAATFDEIEGDNTINWGTTPAQMLGTTAIGGVAGALLSHGAKSSDKYVGRASERALEYNPPKQLERGTGTNTHDVTETKGRPSPQVETKNTGPSTSEKVPTRDVSDNKRVNKLQDVVDYNKANGIDTPESRAAEKRLENLKKAEDIKKANGVGKDSPLNKGAKGASNLSDGASKKMSKMGRVKDAGKKLGSKVTDKFGKKAATEAAEGAGKKAGKVAAKKALTKGATKIGGRLAAAAAAAAVPGPGWALAAGIVVTVGVEALMNDSVRTWLADKMRTGDIAVNTPPEPPTTHFLPYTGNEEDKRNDIIEQVDKSLTTMNKNFINIDPQDHRLWDLESPGVDRISRMENLATDLNSVSQKLNNVSAGFVDIYKPGVESTWLGDTAERFAPDLKLLGSFDEGVASPIAKAGTAAGGAANDVFQSLREGNAISREAIAKSNGKWFGFIGSESIKSDNLTDNRAQVEDRFGYVKAYSKELEDSIGGWLQQVGEKPDWGERTISGMQKHDPENEGLAREQKLYEEKQAQQQNGRGPVVVDMTQDANNNGIADYLEMDSDGDGVPDVVEDIDGTDKFDRNDFNPERGSKGRDDSTDTNTTQQGGGNGNGGGGYSGGGGGYSGGGGGVGNGGGGVWNNSDRSGRGGISDEDIEKIVDDVKKSADPDGVADSTDDSKGPFDTDPAGEGEGTGGIYDWFDADEIMSDDKTPFVDPNRPDDANFISPENLPDGLLPTEMENSPFDPGDGQFLTDRDGNLYYENPWGQICKAEDYDPALHGPTTAPDGGTGTPLNPYILSEGEKPSYPGFYRLPDGHLVVLEQDGTLVPVNEDASKVPGVLGPNAQTGGGTLFGPGLDSSNPITPGTPSPDGGAFGPRPDTPNLDAPDTGRDGNDPFSPNGEDPAGETTTETGSYGGDNTAPDLGYTADGGSGGGTTTGAGFGSSLGGESVDATPGTNTSSFNPFDRDDSGSSWDSIMADDDDPTAPQGSGDPAGEADGDNGFGGLGGSGDDTSSDPFGGADEEFDPFNTKSRDVSAPELGVDDGSGNVSPMDTPSLAETVPTADYESPEADLFSPSGDDPAGDGPTSTGGESTAPDGGVFGDMDTTDGSTALGDTDTDNGSAFDGGLGDASGTEPAPTIEGSDLFDPESSAPADLFDPEAAPSASTDPFGGAVDYNEDGFPVDDNGDLLDVNDDGVFVDPEGAPILGADGEPVSIDEFPVDVEEGEDGKYRIPLDQTFPDGTRLTGEVSVDVPGSEPSAAGDPAGDPLFDGETTPEGAFDGTVGADGAPAGAAPAGDIAAGAGGNAFGDAAAAGATSTAPLGAPEGQTDPGAAGAGSAGAGAGATGAGGSGGGGAFGGGGGAFAGDTGGAAGAPEPAPVYDDPAAGGAFNSSDVTETEDPAVPEAEVDPDNPELSNIDDTEGEDEPAGPWAGADPSAESDTGTIGTDDLMVDINGQQVQFVSPEAAEVARQILDPATQNPPNFSNFIEQYGLQLPDSGDIGQQISPAEMQPGDVVSSEGKNYIVAGGDEVIDPQTGSFLPLAEVASFEGPHDGIFRLDPGDGSVEASLGGSLTDGPVDESDLTGNTVGGGNEQAVGTGNWERSETAPIGMGAGQNVPGREGEVDAEPAAATGSGNSHPTAADGAAAAAQQGAAGGAAAGSMQTSSGSGESPLNMQEVEYEGEALGTQTIEGSSFSGGLDPNMVTGQS